MKKFVLYHRVSTKEQGDSKLGLEAQRRVNISFVDSSGGAIIKEFTEIVSGAYSKKIPNNINLDRLLKKRPILKEAVQFCLANKATLLVKELSRLGRNSLLISYLIQRGLDFICADSPNDSTFILQIKASLYEEEVRNISERTKAAMASLKARGVKLGKIENLKGQKQGAKARLSEAMHNYSDLEKLIFRLKSKKYSLRDIAHELNESGFCTTKGASFRAVTVKRIIDRVYKTDSEVQCIKNS